jgi:hypothetical protein
MFSVLAASPLTRGYRHRLWSLILARRPGTDFHRILGKVDFIKGQWLKIPPHIVEFDPSKEAWNRLPQNTR